MDHPFHRRRNQKVAFLFQNRVAVFEILGVGVALPPAVFFVVGVYFFHAQAVVIHQCAVVFENADNFRAVFGFEDFGGVVADITESLDDNGLAFERAFEAGSFSILRVAEEFADAVHHAPARRFGASRNAAQADRFAGDTAEGIDIVRAVFHISVGDPRHLLGAGAKIRCRNVDARTNEVLLDQLECVSPGDPLQFGLGELVPGDLDAPLGSAKRHIDNGALVGHQRRQRHHLVLVDRHAVADATLGRLLVMAVFRPPRLDHLDGAVVPLDGKAHVVDAVALADLRQQRGMMPCERGRSVETTVYLCSEVELLGH